MKKNIETFIACDAEYEDAKVVIFGAPFDSTTSYRPGARFGSAAIRHESYGLETYSPYLNCDLEDLDVYDAGDLELPMGSAEMALDAMPNLKGIYNEQTGHKMMMFHLEDATAFDIAVMGDGEKLL